MADEESHRRYSISMCSEVDRKGLTDIIMTNTMHERKSIMAKHLFLLLCLVALEH